MNAHAIEPPAVLVKVKLLELLPVPTVNAGNTNAPEVGLAEIAPGGGPLGQVTRYTRATGFTALDGCVSGQLIIALTDVARRVQVPLNGCATVLFAELNVSCAKPVKAVGSETAGAVGAGSAAKVHAPTVPVCAAPKLEPVTEKPAVIVEPTGPPAPAGNVIPAGAAAVPGASW